MTLRKAASGPTAAHFPMSCHRLPELYCFGNIAIAPQAFRSIEALIGSHNQLLGAAVPIVKQDGNAAADADIGRCGGLRMSNSHLHYRVFGGFSDLQRIAQPGLWEDYAELLA